MIAESPSQTGAFFIWGPHLLVGRLALNSQGQLALEAQVTVGSGTARAPDRGMTG